MMMVFQGRRCDGTGDFRGQPDIPVNSEREKGRFTRRPAVVESSFSGINRAKPVSTTRLQPEEIPTQSPENVDNAKDFTRSSKTSWRSWTCSQWSVRSDRKTGRECVVSRVAAERLLGCDSAIGEPQPQVNFQSSNPAFGNRKIYI